MQQFRRSGPARTRLGAVMALSAVLFAGCASVTTTQQDASTEPVQAVQPRPADAPVARPTVVERKAAPSVAQPPERAARAEPAWGPDASLWDRMRAGFAMPELNSPLVAEKERFYLSKPEYLQRMFQRGNRYLFYIVEELERRGMPTELALLPFVESAMNPVAVSPAKAAGLWQFIPSTGKAYNLHQNWWVDNRRDPVKSTHAALDYLQKIYEMHGNDWFLALASYNWGEGAVGRAVKKSQARGGSGDYLSLDMPAETRHYVPKLIALKNILMRSGELGLALPELPNRPYFVTIEKTRPIDLKLAAQFAGMSVEEFLTLNPAHNRPVIAASRNNQIKLPADRRDAFLAAVERHEHARKTFATWQPYTLKSGETIETVAHAAGTSAQELRQANSLRENQRIVAGTNILAPQQTVDDEMKVEQFVAPRVYEQVDRPAVYHTVGNTESIGTIAHRYGITAATLAAWNGIKQSVRRGMRLLVQPAATQTLLTNEEGDRSIVATAPKPGFIKVAAPAVDDAPVEPAKPRGPAPAAKAPDARTQTAASRVPDRHASRNETASRTRVASQSAAKAVAKAGAPERRSGARAATEPKVKRAAGPTPARGTARDDRKAPVRADSGQRSKGA